MLAEHIELLDPSIFRTYDIRGIVGQTLTEQGVYLIGKAVGSCAREAGETYVAIARDGRLSSPMLSEALSKGLQASGCHVINLGIAPTPLLYFATHTLPTRSGIMLTGSHNPPDYNGLKIVVNGEALAEDNIKNLYHRIQENRFTVGNGQEKSQEITLPYIEKVKALVSVSRPLKIVIDAGNGVTGMIAPALFKALGCEVIELFCDVDGHFPNHHPDPSQTENLQDLIATVKANKADIGLAFDGDGDRLGVVTNKGEVIWPDRLLMLFAKALLIEHPAAKIIFDVKCTTHLAHVIADHGGEPIMWKTGHSLIKAKLAETKAQLAGEMSGHFFFKHRWFGFDDALYAAARLLEILAKDERECDAIFATIPNSVNTPELKIAVAEDEKFILMQRLIEQANFKEAKDILTIDGLRVNFEQGWGLVRPSNTTPYLILRFEANTQAILDHIQAQFRQWLLSVEAKLVLPF